MKRWIERLHLGQVIILGLGASLLGSAFFAGGVVAGVGYQDAVRVREERSMELAEPDPLENLRPLQERFLFQETRERPRQEIRSEYVSADRRTRRLSTASVTLFSGVSLVFLGYVGVLWVWFGGRRRESE